MARRQMGWVRRWVGALGVVGLALVPSETAAQASLDLVVDSIVVEGNLRNATEDILALAPFVAGDTVDIADIQALQRALWSTRQYSDIQVYADDGATPGRGVIRIVLEEQATVRRVLIQGLENADPDLVTDSAGVLGGSPYDDQAVARAKVLVREALADEGIPFASIEDRLEPVEGLVNVVDLVFEVAEGNRVTVAQVVVRGNDGVVTEDVIAAMGTRPEGFWWFQGGEFDEAAFDLDRGTRLPDLYASRGYLDMEVLSDTLVIDPTTGKARVELDIAEGLQYRVAALNIDGNRHFDDERLERFFLPQQGGLLRSLGFGGAEIEEAEALGRVYDRIAYESAEESIRQLYYNEGYIFAQTQLVETRRPPTEEGGDPTVSLTFQIQEGQPAYIGQIDIEGNDYTYERVIRDRIILLPGDVYSQDRLLQSYQGISALGFFEAPLPFPRVEPNQETGEVDITFEVIEKQTGAINFGTSVGGGIGLAGFIGYDQPNLFGQAKAGSLRWDFGRFVNNFTVSYSDPQLFQTRTTGTVSLFNARDRFFSFQSGQRRRLGGSVRLGFPIPGARFTRVFTGYSIARTRYDLSSSTDDNSLFGLPPGTQSQLQVGVTRTTLNHPIFPYSGSRLSWNVELNGGILGGDGDFTRHLVEGTWWLPIGQVGGDGPDGGRPIIFAFGTSVKGGALFGDPSNFPFDRFWMGGVQFGQQLRGYDETSITPFGFFPERSRGISDIDRLGDAFLTITTELAMRLNDNISLSAFMDAGNVWADALDIDPSRLFRGAGVGVQLVTPFGPIGLDYAYGFDKPVPGWQLHFRMGP
ncbi:MAG: outer membrane protein assembly factor BamA, partial [Gemmatimonadetes bacterium]|nr:outer membrane protein assembly factor BamA [Gemmatimonadota bacterium]